MTTHPPGHPSGPTGPGREPLPPIGPHLDGDGEPCPCTPGPPDAALRPSDDPGADPATGLRYVSPLDLVRAVSDALERDISMRRPR